MRWRAKRLAMRLSIFIWANPETDYDAKVIGQADRAIALAPDNMRAYSAKSAYLVRSRRADEALRTADAGLAINPNYAPLYSMRSTCRNLPLASSNKRNPMCNKRCG